MKSAAFTLFECLIVLTLLVILATLSWPSLRFFWSNLEVAQVTRSLAGLINYARIYALTSGETVAICGSGTSHACDGHWEIGCFVSTTQQILRQQKISGPITICYHGSLEETKRVSFNALGESGEQQGRWLVCDFNKTFCNAIVLIRSGRIRIEKVGSGDAVC